MHIVRSYERQQLNKLCAGFACTLGASVAADAAHCCVLLNMEQTHLCATHRGVVLPEMLLQHVVSDFWRKVPHEDGVIHMHCSRKQHKVMACSL